jgi:hypothetical protein
MFMFPQNKYIDTQSLILGYPEVGPLVIDWVMRVEPS